jgi:hypothetical protein
MHSTTTGHGRRSRQTCDMTMPGQHRSTGCACGSGRTGVRAYHAQAPSPAARCGVFSTTRAALHQSRTLHSTTSTPGTCRSRTVDRDLKEGPLSGGGREAHALRGPDCWKVRVRHGRIGLGASRHETRVVRGVNLCACIGGQCGRQLPAPIKPDQRRACRLPCPCCPLLSPCPWTGHCWIMVHLG